ncbi:MAG TPA: tetratricopeptide repeat protein [Mycobacteriales bacterium]|jgi:Flp pilus assembly protein TadD|nr:tetratricopeptide repeat protein [Mycobacteriales bacterium]
MTPDELYSEYRRAHEFLAAGHPVDAAAIVTPVVQQAPEHTGALELQARALFMSAQLGRAETALTELVRRCPDDGWARIALARTLERSSRHHEAAAHRGVAAALGVRA